jgi:methionyl-tRNA formyltransferase
MGLRIVLIGQAAFAEQVLRGLIDRGDQVVAVYSPPDSGARPDPLKQLAVASGIPCRQPASYKPAAFRDEVAALAADLLILAFVTLIVPENVLALPRLGSICFHPSLLPKYRGGSAVNWAVINGERETGVSVFWPDAGIDTGPLLLQRTVPIDPDDSTGSLYYKRILPAGVTLVLDSVALIADGRAPREPQDESRASYEPLCRDPHGHVDWTKPAAVVHNLIRGCDPQPGAYTDVGGSRVRWYESRLAPDAAKAAPGTVVAAGEDGVVIAAADGAVRLAKARVDGTSEKKPAADAIASLGLAPGARLA